ncbi:unnamed protein product [Trichogramma brassicae]|uniref:Uncharacterized protein n=1 Tax=Trichogramma brassicae TaxID=86971 RepID=A0A6H5IS29_9HYME|nr:unnamed protein product [Trichogramma brassicae]
MAANGNSPLDNMRTLEHYLSDIMRAGAADTPEHLKATYLRAIDIVVNNETRLEGRRGTTNRAPFHELAAKRRRDFCALKLLRLKKIRRGCLREPTHFEPAHADANRSRRVQSRARFALKRETTLVISVAVASPAHIAAGQLDDDDE